MKENLYKKEIWLTIIFSALLLLMGHSAQFFVFFPGLQQGTFWGFPTQYILPIVFGWFGMAVICLVMAIVCNRFDDEMEAHAAAESKNKIRVTEIN